MLKIFKDNFEKTIAIIAILFASCMALYAHRLGLTLALTDQSAHLNFARLTFDSFTPGLSQIGFWPPLLHILMIPAVAIKPLYISGFAGFVTLIPFLIAGAILLYRLVMLLTGNKNLSFLSSLILLINPYILYYTATPMAEVLFISNLIAVAYFFSLWIERGGGLRYLILCGIFVSLASLSRFEGLILLPILFTFILLKFFWNKKKWPEIEAVGILFGFVAVLGLAFILIFSWVYSGNALTFAGGGWWLRSPVEGVKLAQGNLLLSLEYVLHALYYMVGKPFTIISLSLIGPLLILFRNRMRLIAPLIILASPMLFIIYSLFNGSVPMNLPELPPVNGFLNERYVLSFISFIALELPLFIYLFNKRLSFKRILYSKLLISVFIIFTLLFIFQHFYSVVIVKDFETIRRNTGVPSDGQLQLADYLAENYDYGKILAVRVDNDPVFVAAGLSLRHYIHEANFRFYDQVYYQPWFFSRWVVMYNSDDTTDKWARLQEPVSTRWRNDQWFHKYYELVYVNHKKELYRIKEGAIRKLASDKGYKVDAIPSINPSIETWDESKIYKEIGLDGGDKN